MLLTALLSCIVATLAQHLGLTEAVARIGLRIARCSKCTSFWATVLVLAFSGCEPAMIAGLSVLSAYLSHWVGLALLHLNNLYNSIWQRKTNHQGR